MTNKQIDMLALGAAAGVLVASFLAFASTKSGSAFISITHMAGLFYLLPVLGLVALVFAILSLSKKLDTKFASLALGATMLGLSLFTGIQARAQLDGFVYMQYEMQAKRAQFDANFSARKAAIEKFMNDDSTSATESAMPTSPPPVPEIKPIAILDGDTSTWGAGFYVSIVASLILLACGGLLLKGTKDEIAAPV